MDGRIAIADMGATKGEWALLDSDGHETFQTRGLNAMSANSKALKHITLQLRSAFGDQPPSGLQYYGAGVKGKPQAEVLRRFFREQFPGMECRFYSDLEAVVHGSLHGKEGIVAILGTGSNAGYFNGTELTQAVPALGYLLGDEGSGFAIGRDLIRYYMDGKLTNQDTRAIEYKFGIDQSTLISRLYSAEDARSVISSFAEYAIQAKDEKPFMQIIRHSFNTFIRRSVCPYPADKPVHCTGSIAFHAKELLSSTLASHGYTLHGVSRSPLTGLIDYYRKKMHK